MSNKARQIRKEISKAMSNLDAYIEKDEALQSAVSAHFDTWIDDVVIVNGVEREAFIQVLKRDGIWPRVSRFIHEQNLSVDTLAEQERSIIEAYLNRRGWRESSSAKHYLNALNKSSYALWEVIDRSEHRIIDVRAYGSSDKAISIVDGHSGLLALAGDCICARLLSLGSKHYFAEGKLLMPAAHMPQFFEDNAEFLTSRDRQGSGLSMPQVFFRHWAVVSYNKASSEQASPQPSP